MATPFAPYTNLRLRYEQRSVIPDLREGTTAPASTVVIDCFARIANAGTGDQDVGGLALGTSFMTGYIARHAVLPGGANWLDLGVSWPWATTGLRPEGLKAGHQLQAFWGDLDALPATDDAVIGWLTLTQVGPALGAGGIGGMLRTAVGDKFSGLFSETR